MFKATASFSVLETNHFQHWGTTHYINIEKGVIACARVHALKQFNMH